MNRVLHRLIVSAVVLIVMLTLSSTFFNTKDSVPVTLDVAVSYGLAAERVPEFYTKFRAERIESFTHGFLRDTARNVIVAVGSEYTFDDVKRPQEGRIPRVDREKLDAKVAVYGIGIQQFGLIGSLRPPQALLEAVGAKSKAIQDSIRTENEVRSAQAEAKSGWRLPRAKRRPTAHCWRRSNRSCWNGRGWKLQKDAINKWNGVMPSVMTDGGGNMLFNIPAHGSGPS
ncbi:prohibitin family protein [Massilia sp. B-10]|nr:prohibitin family protein [Massilia sp. B-10]